MAGKRLGEIRINKRTVQIGHQVYPLANISRVQSGRLTRGRTGAQLARFVVFLILVAVLTGLVLVRA